MCLPSNLSGVTIQRIAVAVANLLCLNFGLIFGITPMHMQLYQFELETPLNKVIYESDIIWLVSYLLLGAAAGSAIFGMLPKRFGPKTVLQICGLLQILSWFCIHFAFNIEHVFASRIFAGLAAGGTFSVLPSFIAEISESAHCAALNASMEQWRTYGIFMGIILSCFVSHENIALVGCGLSLIFNATFPFVRETPYHYMRRDDMTGMEKSLRWFNGIRSIDERNKPEFQEKIAKIKNEMLDQEQHVAMCTMQRVYELKYCIICGVLCLGAISPASYMLLTHAIKLFPINSLEFEPNFNSLGACLILLSFMQFLGACLMRWIGLKLNRHLLLCLSAASCTGCLLTLAYGDLYQRNPFHAPWLELCLICLHLLSAHVGLYPLFSIISGELMPFKQHSTIFSDVMSLFWMANFALVQYFDYIVSWINYMGLYSLLGSISMFLLIFAILLMFDTRNKSLEEVQQIMGYIKASNVANISSATNGTIRPQPEITMYYI